MSFSAYKTPTELNSENTDGGIGGGQGAVDDDPAFYNAFSRCFLDWLYLICKEGRQSCCQCMRVLSVEPLALFSRVCEWLDCTLLGCHVVQGDDVFVWQWLHVELRKMKIELKETEIWLSAGLFMWRLKSPIKLTAGFRLYPVPSLCSDVWIYLYQNSTEPLYLTDGLLRTADIIHLTARLLNCFCYRSLQSRIWFEIFLNPRCRFKIFLYAILTICQSRSQRHF